MNAVSRLVFFGIVIFVTTNIAQADQPDSIPGPRNIRPTTMIAIADPAFPSFLPKKAKLANYESLESIKNWVKKNQALYLKLITVPEGVNSITFTNATPDKMPDNRRYRFTVAYQKLYPSIQIQRYQLEFDKEDKSLHQDRVKNKYTYLVSEKDLAILKKLLKGYVE